MSDERVHVLFVCCLCVVVYCVYEEQRRTWNGPVLFRLCVITKRIKIYFLANQMCSSIESVQFVKDMSFLIRYQETFQLEVGPSLLRFHILSPTQISYLVYSLPYRWTESSPSYYAVSMLSFLATIQQVFASPTALSFSMEHVDDRHFLCASSYPQNDRSAKIELSLHDSECLLDVSATTLPRGEWHASHSELLKWVSGEVTLSTTHVWLYIPAPSELIIATCEDAEPICTVKRRRVSTHGQDAKTSVDVHELTKIVAFYTDEAFVLRWTDGRPLELEMRNLRVFLAPPVDTGTAMQTGLSLG